MLSRRQFLQAAGIVVVASRLPAIAASPVPRLETLYGRALTTAPIHAAPDSSAPILTRLWSDTVVPLRSTDGAWYRLDNGFAPRETFQPMIAPVRRTTSPDAPPFWGEVSGAIAVVREWCAADAPIVARVGHGGILQVIDYLPGEINWYGVADASGVLLGWTQTAAWSPADLDDTAPSLTLEIDTAVQELRALDADRLLLTAPISTGEMLTPGVYPIADRAPTHTSDHPGAAWSLAFGGHTLDGVYWHNRFGAQHPGAAVQVTPALAKWLYSRTNLIIIH